MISSEAAPQTRRDVNPSRPRPRFVLSVEDEDEESATTLAILSQTRSASVPTAREHGPRSARTHPHNAVQERDRSDESPRSIPLQSAARESGNVTARIL